MAPEKRPGGKSPDAESQPSKRSRRAPSKPTGGTCQLSDEYYFLVIGAFRVDATPQRISLKLAVLVDAVKEAIQDYNSHEMSKRLYESSDSDKVGAEPASAPITTTATKTVHVDSLQDDSTEPGAGTSSNVPVGLKSTSQSFSVNTSFDSTASPSGSEPLQSVKIPAEALSTSNTSFTNTAAQNVSILDAGAKVPTEVLPGINASATNAVAQNETVADASTDFGARSATNSNTCSTGLEAPITSASNTGGSSSRTKSEWPSFEYLPENLRHNAKMVFGMSNLRENPNEEGIVSLEESIRSMSCFTTTAGLIEWLFTTRQHDCWDKENTFGPLGLMGLVYDYQRKAILDKQPFPESDVLDAAVKESLQTSTSIDQTKPWVEWKSKQGTGA